MTDTVTVAIISGGFAFLGVLVQRLAARVDGRLTQLLELTAKASHAKGVKDEKENNTQP